MTARRLPLLVATLALAACGGRGASQPTAETKAAAPPPASATTATATGAAGPEAKLAAAGLRPVEQPVPASVPGANRYVITPAGPVVVYIFGFPSIAAARRYARRIAAQVRTAKGTLLARRVGTTIYVGTAADRRAVARQLRRVIRAAEGTNARPVRVGPS